MPWYDELDDEQREAASHLGSHARLLAGPGTGKTRVMARRVAYLATDRRVLTTSILALTFTRHAAAELRQRVIGLVDIKPPPHVLTLHSFALRQLLRNAALLADNLPAPLRIADDFEERLIIIEDLKALLGRTARKTQEALSKLSADWETLRAETQDWQRDYPDSKFLGAWLEHRGVYGYLLRAELVYRLKRSLEGNPDFTLESPISHLLVDEYQDLNRCDLAVVKAVTQRGAELFAAGDDDQSIYGFRYAHPLGIRQFSDDYADAREMHLALCHRCDPAILQLGLFVAEQDYQRIDKPLRPEDGRPDGDVHLLRFGNQSDEAEGVAVLCQRLIRDRGYRPHEILILLRFDRNAVYSRPLREALEQAAVPVAVEAERDPFGLAIGNSPRPGRFLLALMHLAVSLDDHLAWRTLLQFSPGNGIGVTTIGSVYGLARQRGISFSQALVAIAEGTLEIGGRSHQVASEVRRIRDMVERLTEDVATAWNPLDATAIAEGVRGTIETLTGDESERQAVVSRVRELAEESEAEDVAGLLRALSSASAELDQHIEEGRVNILTMHKAKGLTADAVFVIAAEDEVLPGKAQSADAVADERRLLYVSLTRARHVVFITHCEQRTDQQAYTGRNSGNPRRNLTRFLRDGPLTPEPGLAFARRFDG